jgi:RNA polymerase subunit RPABC4/transcription elongation factor Spt4
MLSINIRKHCQKIEEERTLPNSWVSIVLIIKPEKEPVRKLQINISDVYCCKQTNKKLQENTSKLNSAACQKFYTL